MDQMANRKLSDVVVVAEGTEKPCIFSATSNETAADYLVCRMFTDAIFNEDIRTIQLIINRIDGGLPKDVEMGSYRTQFADCFDEIMQMTSDQQMKLHPDDSVMMALCKALYALATQDIYWDAEKGIPRRPSTDAKKDRDTALRMVLERTGGRKTIPKQAQQKETLEEAGWLKNLKLPEANSTDL